MVSCLLTRVILNVSVALTIQCYQPNGTIYNKTICAMLPPHMAKLEILKDIFKENNMSIPHNLITTPVVLLEPQSDEDDIYVDDKKSKIYARSRPMRVGSTRIHPYKIRKEKNSEEEIRDKALKLNKIKPESLELKFNTKASIPTYCIDTVKDTDYTSNPNIKTEPTQQASTKFADKFTFPQEIRSLSEELAIHDNIVANLAQHINSGGKQATDCTTNLTEPNTQLNIENTNAQSNNMYQVTTQKNKVNLNPSISKEEKSSNDKLQSVPNKSENNTIDPVVAKFVSKYTYPNKMLSFSEELAMHHKIANSLQDNIGNYLPEEPLPYNYSIWTPKPLKFQWEMNSEEKRKEREEHASYKMMDRINHIHKCMSHQFVNFVSDNNIRRETIDDIFNDQDGPTEPYVAPERRIEKRSIPNTNPKSDDETVSPKSDEICNNETTKAKHNGGGGGEFIFPGADRFWDVFMTSPVDVILNTSNVESTTSDYEKHYFSMYYENLRNTKNSQQKQQRCESDEFQTKTQIDESNEDKIDHLMKGVDNPTSLEKNVARKLIEKPTREPVDLEKRLGTEKYFQYLEIKKVLDAQYKEIREHLNRTDTHIQKLFHEMKGLKEEKQLADYYEQHEDHFTHLTTPESYLDTILYISNVRSPDITEVASYNYSMPEAEDVSTSVKDAAYSEENDESKQHGNYDILDGSRPFDHMPHKGMPKGDISSQEKTTFNNVIHKKYFITKATEYYNAESLEAFDRQKYHEQRELELKQSGKTIIPNISQSEIDLIHETILKRLQEKSINITKLTPEPITESQKPWFEESIFDPNDPKIQYAKYLHNVRNMSVKLNMEVGKKTMRTISYFDKENKQYAHQYKQTTEHRRFSHMIPFWLTQPKEIEDIFKGNTKIFREYIQYILDKNNFTELPVHGRFAFIRRYINKLNNPLIFNRITVFPTAYATTDHVKTFKEQLNHFKINLKHKIHKAYKHVKHFLFNSSLDETHPHVPIKTNPQTLPEEVVINFTTPPPIGQYYEGYY